MHHGPWYSVRDILAAAGDDPDWVATAASPEGVFTPGALNGRVAGGVALAWELLDATGATLVPTGTYSYRLIEVIHDGQPPAQVYAGAAVVGASFADELRIPACPGAGSRYALRVYTKAGLPGGSTLRLWVKGLIN